MSEIKPENQDKNLMSDSFNDEDDLWALQSDQENDSSIDIDGFDDEKEELSNLSKSPQEEEKIIEDFTNKTVEKDLLSINSETDTLNEDENEQISKLEELEENTENISSNINDVKEHIENVEPEKYNQEELNTEETEVSHDLKKLVKTSLKELEEKRENLEKTIANLERRRNKIEKEMKTNFAGVSQDLAIRLQGFKDYLVGSLQDLAAAAEQLELSSSSNDKWEEEAAPVTSPENQSSAPQFAEQNFTKERQEIRRLLDQYRTRPDYYGPAWQLRRTFEPIHAEKVADWFFNQGGRGALTSMGSRLQNILIASAIISLLSHLYGDRSRILILADTPEKLGEWRRGLQDCLGISRGDFGPNRGVILFETANALIKKGDRIMEQDDLPLVIMDLNDDRVSLSLLKFPLWLAFAPESPMPSSEYYY